MTNSNQTWTKRWQRNDLLAAIIAVISFLGFLDASYLTAQHYFTLPLPCSLTQGCDIVLTSAYSTFAGIPVAFFGTLYYLAILCSAAYILTAEKSQRRAAFFMLALVSAGIALSCFFVYLQVFVIHALCMYCLGSATLTSVLFILIIFLNRASAKPAD